MNSPIESHQKVETFRILATAHGGVGGGACGTLPPVSKLTGSHSLENIPPSKLVDTSSQNQQPSINHPIYYFFFSLNLISSSIVNSVPFFSILIIHYQQPRHTSTQHERKSLPQLTSDGDLVDTEGVPGGRRTVQKKTERPRFSETLGVVNTQQLRLFASPCDSKSHIAPVKCRKEKSLPAIRREERSLLAFQPPCTVARIACGRLKSSGRRPEAPFPPLSEDLKDDEAKQLFYQNYGDLPYLLDVKVDRHLFRAMVQFWNPAYCCFTFGDIDLIPTLEEYTALLHYPRIQGYKAYVRPASLLTFMKKLVIITGMSEQWAVAHVKKRVDVLALSIYGLVIFQKALGHIDEAVADLFDRLGKQNTPVPAILAETFRSLSACRRAGERRFIGCAQLLLVWFHSHFWKVDKVPCRVFFKDYSPLKEVVDMPRRDDILEERWIDILQNFREEDVMWKALWLFDWVPLPGIWGVVGYAPLLVLRQYRVRQFIPATQGLAQSDFSYKGDHYKKRMREISEAWKKPFCVKILTEGSISAL
ncbi:hypothetical protein CXB51_024213 [Gossypium anomalum]|uniref:DUF7745 domain-containing protein n=1 Tax=Gossypium anomalum TaxID=47600 RepID=A0A8J6CUA7_9ROSI|nr:hypothetical protein CXB51_024213 [Gossypium anomalum]